MGPSWRTIPPVLYDWIFILLGLAIMLFLVRRRRHDAVLSSGFFSLFLLLTAADVVVLLANEIFMGLPNTGLFTEAFFDCVACVAVNQALTHYCYVLQPFAQLAMAVNRFTCFHYEGLHRRLWSGKWFRGVVVILLAAPLPLNAYLLPQPAGYRRHDVDGGFYIPRYADQSSIVVRERPEIM
ncbi:hypothetical protein AAVH_28622 [Aphelenchoides avenae]|nr:hypothetical protein AAVH_28622 [Aphelenchus avenae]